MFRPTAPSVTDITRTLARSNSITFTCNIHPDSITDHCVVMATADSGATGTST